MVVRKVCGGYLVFTYIKVNGIKYNALVDTGASTTVVSKKVKRNSKLTTGTYSTVQGLGTSSKSQRASCTFSANNNSVDGDVEIMSFTKINNKFVSVSIPTIDIILGTHHILSLNLHREMYIKLQDVYRRKF